MMKFYHLKKSAAVFLAALVMAGGAAVSPAVTAQVFAAGSSTETKAVPLGFLENLSEISDSSITLGSKVTLYGIASGNSSTFKFGYYYKKTTASSWSTIRNYSTTTEVSFKPTSAADYDILIKVKDDKGNVAEKTFSLKVTKLLECTGSMNSLTTPAGQAVTLYGSAKGGEGSYKYAYHYKKYNSSAWLAIRNYSTSSMVPFTPSTPGTFDIRFRVKDAAGTVSEKYYTLTVTKPYKCTGAVSTAKTTVGQTVTLYGSASGGEGSYQYSYLYKTTNTSKWTTLKDYSSTTITSFKPDTVANYDICIKVKDSSGKITKKYFTLSVMNPIEFSLDYVDTDVYVNSRFDVFASADNSGDTYSYAFYYKKSSVSKWTLAQDYSSFKSIALCTYSFPSDGIYDFKVNAKNKNGNIATKTGTVSVRYADLYNNSEISSDSLTLGEKVTITAKASGGDNNYSYRYQYKLTNTSEFTTISDYSQSTKLNFTPSKAGNYTLRVTVKDGQNHYKSKDFIVKVSELSSSVPQDIVRRLITQNMSDFDKVIAIHDWIINNTRYDYDNYLSGNIPWSSYTAEGVYQYGRAVCDGYSKAFQELAELAGLTVNRVTGKAINGFGQYEAHAWNQVKVDGKWYNIDVTWDDPVSLDSSPQDKLQYIYFLVPDSDFQDHTASSEHYSCTTAQPAAKICTIALQQDMAEDPYCAYCENTTQMKNAITNFHNNGIDHFHLIYKTSLTDSQAIFKQVFAACPSECGKSASAEQWKLNGYYYIDLTLS